MVRAQGCQSLSLKELTPRWIHCVPLSLSPLIFLTVMGNCRKVPVLASVLFSLQIGCLPCSPHWNRMACGKHPANARDSIFEQTLYMSALAWEKSRLVKIIPFFCSLRCFYRKGLPCLPGDLPVLRRKVAMWFLPACWGIKQMYSYQRLHLVFTSKACHLKPL